MNGLEFLEKLERGGVVPPAVIERLRGQVTDRTDPRRIIDLLVQRNLARRDQLERILAAAAQPPSDEEELFLLIDDEGPGATTGTSQTSGEEPPVVLDEPPARWKTSEPELPVVLDDPALWTSTLEEAATSGASTYVPARRWQSWWPRGKQRAGSGKLSNRWDSPIILWGGGVLILLGALLVGLIIFLMRGSGNELVAQADEAYQNQNYIEAAQFYQRLIDRHGRHASASHARVKLRLAQLRQAMEREKDLDQSLRIATTALPQLEGEPQIEEAQEELASLLPSLMQGFVDLAANGKDIEQTRIYVERADQVMQLIDNPKYMPSSRRQARQGAIEKILADLDGVRRVIVQEEQLQGTIAKMQGAAQSGEFRQAHQLARDIVRQFPASVNNEALQSSWRGLTAEEQKAVRPLASFPVATTQDDPRRKLRQVRLSDTRGAPLTDLPESIVAPFLVRGAVYGIEARTGQVRWRRFVGFETTVEPLDLAQPHGAVLICDSRAVELVCCASDTGQLRWRLPCPSPPLVPAVLDQHVVVPCQDGQVLRVALADGAVTAAVQLPLPLAGGAAVARGARSVVIPAAYASLYQLAADALACEAALAVGHLPGAIAVAPTPVGSATIICKNLATQRCMVQVFAAPIDSGAPVTYELPGHVLTSPSSDSTRVLVLTTAGGMTMIEAAVDDGNAQLRQLFTVTTPRDGLRASWGVFQKNNIWTVENRLQQHRAVVAQGRLADRGAVLADIRPAGQPRLLGNHLIVPLQFTRFPQVSIIAFTTLGEDLAEQAWRTDIAMPVVAPLSASTQDRALDVVTENGAWYRVTAEALRNGRVTAPAFRWEQPGKSVRLTAGVALSGDRAIYRTAEATGWLVTQRDAAVESRLVAVEPEVAPDHLTGTPQPWHNGVLVAGVQGIHWLEADRGTRLALPFIPPIDVDVQAQWTGIAPLDDAPNDFVVCERSGHVFRVTADRPKGRPGPTLRLAQQNDLGMACFGPAAGLGAKVWVASGKPETPKVLSIDAQHLQIENQWPLAAPIVWGPARVGPIVVAVDQSGTIHLWSGPSGDYEQVSTGAGPVVGVPQWHDDQLWLACVAGQVVAIDPAAKSVSKTIEMSEPLGGGPSIFGRYVIAVSGDGTLCVAEINSN